jgi:hypothetical protein
MKLKELIQGSNPKLKVIITESQFKRLADNLLDNKHNRSNTKQKKNDNGSKR